MTKVYINGIRARSVKEVRIDYEYKPHEVIEIGSTKEFHYQPLIIKDLSVEIISGNLSYTFKKEDDEE